MRTIRIIDSDISIFEMLTERFLCAYFSQRMNDYEGSIDEATADIHQLLCDSMATVMYRCMEHILLDREGLAKVRLAEYGFSKEEIEKSISKLENE